MITQQARLKFFAGFVPKETGCWEWTGKLRNQYPAVRVNGKPMSAHRLSWVLSGNELQDGLFVCHHCDNPRCVRPSHLFLGTSGDNTRDAARKGRLAGRKNFKGIVYRTTVCKNGHDVTDPDNIYVYDLGYRHRVCKLCQREWLDRKRAQRPERGLTQLQQEAIRLIVESGKEWVTPMMVGASNGSWHSQTFLQLTRKGILESRNRSLGGVRPHKMYRIDTRVSWLGWRGY